MVDRTYNRILASSVTIVMIQDALGRAVPTLAVAGLATLAGAAFPEIAEAACFNVTRNMAITGSTTAEGQPDEGETVTCDANAPNPFTYGVIATTGQDNITVTIGAGAIINPPGSGVLLDDYANAVNNGTITTTSLNGFGMSKQYQGTLTNNGTITTTGQTAHGMRSLGGFGFLTNTGTVNVSGLNAYGVLAGVNETVVNSGTITASGNGGNGVYMLGGTILTNTATGVITSTLATGVLGAGSRYTVSNTGIITGGNGTAISLAGGVNTINVTGGAITGDVLTGAGVDTLNWIGGGTIAGEIHLNGGDDVANLENLTKATVQPTTVIDGGLGTDTLTLTNAQTSQPERFINWERVSLLTGSQLTVGGDLILGDAETKTGTLTIDSTSSVIASGGSYAISPSVAGSAVEVDNAGLIDLVAGGSSVGDHLTINGNYTGSDGALRLNTTLGNDSSATDMLIVTGNSAGSTLVDVINVNGTGAVTTEGIRIISVGGASDGSFTLLGDYEFNSDPAVVAGAYAYRLYKGGVSTPNDGDWYLRSTMSPVEPEPEPGNPEPEPGPGPELPLYQPGVPVYEAYPQLLLGMNGLPTLQQRVGNRYWSHAGNVMLSEGADPIGSPYAPPQETGVLIENNGVWGRLAGVHTNK